MTTLDTAVACTLEAFRGTAISFDFWHLFSPKYVKNVPTKKFAKAKCKALSKTKIAHPVRFKTVIFSFSAQEP